MRHSRPTAILSFTLARLSPSLCPLLRKLIPARALALISLQTLEMPPLWFDLAPPLSAGEKQGETESQTGMVIAS